jgi:hypothetical protein
MARWGPDPGPSWLLGRGRKPAFLGSALGRAPPCLLPCFAPRSLCSCFLIAWCVLAWSCFFSFLGRASFLEGAAAGRRRRAFGARPPVHLTKNKPPGLWALAAACAALPCLLLLRTELITSVLRAPPTRDICFRPITCFRYGNNKGLRYKDAQDKRKIGPCLLKHGGVVVQGPPILMWAEICHNSKINAPLPCNVP